MTEELNVDELRDEIRDKYAAVVLTPTATFHFHTGRQLTERLGYDACPVTLKYLTEPQLSGR